MAEPTGGAAHAAGEVGRDLAPWAHRLLHVAYDLAFILFLIATSPYFAFRCLRDSALRHSIAGRFGAGPVRTGDRPCVWFHGVSVGEVKAAGNLIQELRESVSGLDLVMSSPTPAGMRVARDQYPDDLVVQFPLDLSFVVRRVLRRIRPRVIVLLELEVWPNLVLQARNQGIPVLIVNGRISERSFLGYRRFRRIFPEFSMVDLYAVQNEEYAGRLRRLGIPDTAIEVTGNLKYDNLRLGIDGPEVARVREELGLGAEDRIVVAGSTHPGEEEALLDTFARLRHEIAGLRLLLAPRHVERAPDVLRRIEKAGLHGTALTTLRRQGQGAPPRSVVLIDTIGELEAFYSIGDVVFVGGSLVPRGGHNILEPAGLGRPVVFGPFMDNFREEMRLLLGHDAAVQVEGPGALTGTVRGLLTDPDQAGRLGRNARDAVARMRGTTGKNLDLILARLNLTT